MSLIRTVPLFLALFWPPSHYPRPVQFYPVTRSIVYYLKKPAIFELKRKPRFITPLNQGSVLVHNDSVTSTARLRLVAIARVIATGRQGVGTRSHGSRGREGTAVALGVVLLAAVGVTTSGAGVEAVGNGGVAGAA